MATSHAQDLMAFVLRYAAAFSVLLVVLNVLAPQGHPGLLSGLTLARHLVYGSAGLLGTLAIGVLYLRLRGETERSVDATEQRSGEEGDR